MISLDGAPSTYKKSRGVNGYEKTVECIKQLSPITDCGIVMTFAKWSTLADYTHVRNIADRYKTNMGLHPSDELPLLTGDKGKALQFQAEELPAELVTQLDSLHQYRRWSHGTTDNRRPYLAPGFLASACTMRARASHT